VALGNRAGYRPLVLKRTGLALVSGVLLSLAFEPVAVAYLIPVAVAGFGLSTRGLPVRRAWVPGLVFGVAFYFPHIYWMSDSIGPPAWIALAALEAIFYGILGAAAGSLHRLRWWPVWLAAGWVTMEIWRSGWPFSGMPWGRLAFGVVDTPVADALAYVGMTGLSFLLALSGFLLAWVVTERERRGRLVAAGVLVGVCLAMAVPSVVPYELEERDTATVAVVQGNVPPPENDILAHHRQVTENHVQATVDLAAEVAEGSQPQPDFVLWPENSTAIDPFRDGSTNAGIRRAATAIGVPILVGAIVDAGEENVLNQGIVWDPVTGAGERYTKHHPVAYGEYAPMRPLLRRLGIEDQGQLGRISRDMLSGTSEEPLSIAGVEVADAICFDVAYDDVSYEQIENGAELLAVQTSNARFIFTDQIDQQFAITRLRAIEAGKSLVVASTNGITGIITPDGEVVASADPRTPDVLLERVGLRPGVTPGVRLGQWFAVLLPLFTGLGLVLRGVTYRRKRPDSAPEPAAPALVGATDQKAISD
jgi:apolipoprotein N-acyltransferase